MTDIFATASPIWEDSDIPGWKIAQADINGRPSTAIWNGKHGSEAVRHAVMGDGAMPILREWANRG